MKRILVLAAVVVGLISHRAGANMLRWDIDELHVEIVVNADSSLSITETIVADFTREQHRGIIREIPYRYRRSGSSWSLRISQVSVTDEAGKPYRVSKSTNDGRLEIKIGDPDVQLRGKVTYVLRYRVQRGLLSFEDHDELYWNAIGDGWPVPIEKATCVVKLPISPPTGIHITGEPEVQPEDVQRTSFIGAFGSEAPGPAGTMGVDYAVEWDLPEGLRFRTGLTVVVGWPKGFVEPTDGWTRVKWFVADNWIMAVPFVVAGILFVWWGARGRDEGQAGPIVVQYEAPDGLRPAEVGLIADESLDERDISATFVDLAVRGYIIIEDERKKASGAVGAKTLRLHRTDKSADDLADFESELLGATFNNGAKTTTASQLEGVFYRTVHSIRGKVEAGLAKKGYFDVPHGKSVSKWEERGLLLSVALAIGFGLLLWFDVFGPLPVIIAAVLTVPQPFIWSFSMPRKTAKGRKALEGVKGLEEYIRRAELQELDAAAKRNRIEALLPYAMALGLSDHWTEAFEDAFNEPPEWYRGTAWNDRGVMWGMARGFRVLGKSASTMPRTVLSVSSGPRSSRGSSWSSRGFAGGSSGFSRGFSGGGGGGGGGRAW